MIISTNLRKLRKEKIRASEFFLYSKKDRDAVEKCMERGYEFPEVTSWIRANKKDFQLVKDMGMQETGILVSCSDYHIFYKMKMTRKQAMEHYLSIVKECLEIEDFLCAVILRILQERIFTDMSFRSVSELRSFVSSTVFR